MLYHHRRRYSGPCALITIVSHNQFILGKLGAGALPGFKHTLSCNSYGKSPGRGTGARAREDYSCFADCISLYDSDTVLLLENRAGTKNSMGSTFSEIAAVLEYLPADRGRLGVCLDTCRDDRGNLDVARRLASWIK
jgi:hypothetical protein